MHVNTRYINSTRDTSSYLKVFTCMPGEAESYCRWLRSLLLCLCDVFWALINSLVCWFSFKNEFLRVQRCWWLYTSQEPNKNNVCLWWPVHFCCALWLYRMSQAQVASHRTVVLTAVHPTFKHWSLTQDHSFMRLKSTEKGPCCGYMLYFVPFTFQ